ncbi:MAG: TlpA family protein disulfide reductase [Burkholderiaceae bacterium]
MPVLALTAAFLTPSTWAEPAPSALLNTPLLGTDTQTHRIDDWRGNLRLINFWATWCKPCRTEIPYLAVARKEWDAQGLEVIGVAIDQPADVLKFSQQIGIRYPLLLAEEQGSNLMRIAGNRVTALPFTLLLDQHGNIIQRQIGPLDASTLRQWLQAATKK